MPLRRLDQILSSYGYCTRSEARAWLRAGRVTIDGKPADKPDAKVDPAKVLIDGQPIEAPDGLLAIYFKPAGLVCSRDGREGPSIYGALPAIWSERNPPVTSVGRLDKDTTGLLLITDVGELVQRWTSPKHKVPKLYDVTVDRDLPAGIAEVFAAGTLQLEDEDKPCLPAKLETLGPREARLELVEGKFHQVKRMFASQGCNVVRLHRSRFGDYDLAGLKEGEWRLIELPAGLAR
jgi:16S rRNA pseudouridine516 synthase